MSILEIKKDLPIKEVAKNLSNYRFNEDITVSVEQLLELITHLEPSQFDQLQYSYILASVTEVLPLSILELLTEDTALSLNTVIYNCKLDAECVSYIIDKHIDAIEIETMLGRLELSNEQVLKVISEGESVFGTTLGEVLGETKNLELIKFVLSNSESINFEDCSRESAILDMRYELFNYLSHVLMTDADSTAIFGKTRPPMSSEELREHDPCAEGWRRVLNWAGRNDTMYSWNEFVARHILANQHSIDDCKSDIEWLASCINEFE